MKKFVKISMSFVVNCTQVSIYSKFQDRLSDLDIQMSLNQLIAPETSPKQSIKNRASETSRIFLIKSRRLFPTRQELEKMSGEGVEDGKKLIYRRKLFMTSPRQPPGNFSFEIILSATQPASSSCLRAVKVVEYHVRSAFGSHEGVGNLPHPFSALFITKN